MTNFFFFFASTFLVKHQKAEELLHSISVKQVFKDIRYNLIYNPQKLNCYQETAAKHQGVVMADTGVKGGQ